MNIISIDPGLTTGVAMKVGKFDGVDLSIYGSVLKLGHYMTCTIVDIEDIWKWINPPPKWDVVICENFAASGRISKYGLHTVRIIGGIQALCFVYKFKFKVQVPQYRLRFIEKAKNIAAKGCADHEIDALAHLLAWENKNESS